MSVWRVGMRMLACLAMVSGALAAYGQQTEAMERLTKAAAQANLELADIKPWHMTLDVTLFDAKGANPTPGTIEVWHSGLDERSKYTFGAASSEELRHGGKTYWNSSGTLPSGAEEVLAEVLHLGPEAGDVSETSPEVRKEKFGKMQLDCIMLGQPLKGNGKAPLGLFPTYCLDPNGDQIRVTYEFGSRSVVATQLGKFLDHQVPMQLGINEGKILVATAKVSALASYTPAPDEFTPGPEMKAVGDVARISGAVIAGTRLTFVQPTYPIGAKMDHRSGVVLLHAIIGRDGHIHSLRPVNGADTDFAIAAIAAVRQWTYRPYTLNGEPTEVETTITVTFSLTVG